MHLRLDQQEDPSALTINTELESGTMMRQFRSRCAIVVAAAAWCIRAHASNR
jgi:hypothetical protein